MKKKLFNDNLMNKQRVVLYRKIAILIKSYETSRQILKKLSIQEYLSKWRCF